MTKVTLDISVIICAYTEARWHDLVAAVESLEKQSHLPKEIIVVVDHNPRLLERVQKYLPQVVAVPNQDKRGLSGARNSGITAAQAGILAFLDEDAVAGPKWLASLHQRYQAKFVLGVGGAIEPIWQDGRPRWFPEEFYWVVGCTYRGMPQTTEPIRNLIGCNMSFRREVFETCGGFRNGIGRVGTRPVGCEETEFCIRVRQYAPQGELLYEPQAKVQHRVSSNRAKWSYFFSRCYSEGLSKALVSRFVGAGDGLASERTYTMKTLPQGVIRNVLSTICNRDTMGLARASAIMAGLAVTTAGFLAGMLSERLAKLKQQGLKTIQFIKIKRFYNKNTVISMPKTANFKPIQVLEVEISRPLPAVSAFNIETGHIYQRAVSFVRLHGKPLGVVELELNKRGLISTEYARQIWQTLETEIINHLQQDGVLDTAKLDAQGLQIIDNPPCQEKHKKLLANAPLASIVVATRDRPKSLEICLDSLLLLDYPNYEIIIVDNAPNTGDTVDLIRHKYADSKKIRYICEEIPGLAIAHNRGLKEVRGNIVAFTDDDVVADKQWLTELVQGFNIAEDVACVTGLILPGELETYAQVWIEQFGGFSKGFNRRIFDIAEHRPSGSLYPYTAGIFGSGANMAFKTSVLRENGGFDPALGAGSRGVGGDDLAAFFDIITGGYKIVYEPAAIIHHRHRRAYAGLRKQAFGYGVGLTAFLTKILIDRPGRILDILIKLPSGLVYLLSPTSPKNSKKQLDYPKELTVLERKGMLYGPIAYLCSRWHTRNLRQLFSSPESSIALTSPPNTPLVDEVS